MSLSQEEYQIYFFNIFLGCVWCYLAYLQQMQCNKRGQKVKLQPVSPVYLTPWDEIAHKWEEIGSNWENLWFIKENEQSHTWFIEQWKSLMHKANKPPTNRNLIQ